LENGGRKIELTVQVGALINLSSLDVQVRRSEMEDKERKL
jgi:hypothetical protein